MSYCEFSVGFNVFEILTPLSYYGVSKPNLELYSLASGLGEVMPVSELEFSCVSSYLTIR